MKKWKTILTLILMLFAVVFEWNWFWGILLMFGLIHYIISEEIHFVEVITKKESPVLFYVILSFWSVLTIYSIQSYIAF